MKQREQESFKKIKQFLLVSGYVLLSLFMNFFNKRFFSDLNQLQFSMLLVQALFSVIILGAFRRSNIKLIKFPPFSATKLKKMWPLSFSYTGQLVLSLIAIRTLSITTYTLGKRITPVVVMVMEFVFYKKKQSKKVILSVAIIVCGAIVAGWGGFNDTVALVGILASLSACILKAIYSLSAQVIGTEKSTPFEMIFYNSLLCVPILIVLVVLFDNITITTISNLLYISKLGSLIFFMIEGITHQTAFYLCTTHASALTTNLASHLKLPLTMILDVTIYGTKLTSQAMIGAGLINFGAILYSLISLKRNNSQEKPTEISSKSKPNDGASV